MRHVSSITPQFYVTAPQACPYLDGRQERKLFTALQNDGADRLNDALSKQGFRRSQNVLYRPSCAECSACLSARIRVADFEPSRSQRRIMRRNSDLRRRTLSPWASEDQYALFRTYLQNRHADGGMADMDVFEFAAMIEETPVRTRVVEYTREAENSHADGALIAVCLTDILDDGVSLVYSFYDPSMATRSLGSHMILDHVDIARELDLPYVYLGYWVPGSPKMDYKSRFAALEIFHEGSWQHVSEEQDYAALTHPLRAEPISEQVANLSLPFLRKIDGSPGS